jgi:hypothetical protein
MNTFYKTALAGAFLTMALSLTGVSSSALAGVTHASHTAFYELSIGRVDANSNIVDARGRMVAEWRLTCRGWTTNQRLIVSMAPGEGEPIASEVTMTSFESLDGKAYSFDSETKIGGETVELVRGKAKRPGPGLPGMARYSEPRGLVLDLPGNTVFPFEHTIEVLEAAARGERRAFSYYFDGSQPEISPMAANSLILGTSRKPEDGAQNTFGKLSDANWWLVRLAMFDGQAATSGNEAPEFEMTQLLQENGVVRRFEFDYGDFTLVAALVKIEEIARPKCG